MNRKVLKGRKGDAKKDKNHRGTEGMEKQRKRERWNRKVLEVHKGDAKNN